MLMTGHAGLGHMHHVTDTAAVVSTAAMFCGILLVLTLASSPESC